MTTVNHDIGPAAFDHIGLATHDLSAPMRFFCGVLGGRPYAGGPAKGFVGAQWEFLAGGRLEAIVPAGAAGGFLRRFLQRRGPGVHHVTFKVSDIHTARVAAERHGYDVVACDDSNPGWKEAFLHPKQAQGIVVQFAESHPDLDSEWNADFEFPAAPQPPALETVRVIGLRLCANEELAARKLWSDLAGGQCESGADELLFTWRDSPLRIAVSVCPRLRPGPIAIELDPCPPEVKAKTVLDGIGSRFVPKGTKLLPRV